MVIRFSQLGPALGSGLRLAVDDWCRLWSLALHLDLGCELRLAPLLADGVRARLVVFDRGESRFGLRLLGEGARLFVSCCCECFGLVGVARGFAGRVARRVRLIAGGDRGFVSAGTREARCCVETHAS